MHQCIQNTVLVSEKGGAPTPYDDTVLVSEKGGACTHYNYVALVSFYEKSRATPH